MKTATKLTILLSVLLCGSALHAQTIAEKKAALKGSSSDLDAESEQYLQYFNQEMSASEKQLKELYARAEEIYRRSGPEEEYRSLLEQINLLKQKRVEMQNTWRDKVSRLSTNETYGLWLAPETNLEQLVIDYGSQDYVYLIPDEIGGIKLSVDSNLPIPRASWSQMLEQILAQNGVGIRTLNPYLRQLYSLKTNNSVLKALTNDRKELDIWPDDTRIGFVLSPEAAEVRRAYVFLQKFADPNTTSLTLIGRDILIMGFVSDIQDLMKLYDFVAANRGEKEYRLVPLFKIEAGEMAKILEAVFENAEEAPVVMESAGAQGGNAPAASVTKLNESNGLNIVTLENMTQALFLVGTKDEIKHAEEVIRGVEAQLSGAREKVVYWYTVRHSDPEELAEMLIKIYGLMISTGTGMEQRPEGAQTNVNNDQKINITEKPAPLSSQLLYADTFYQQGGYVINPAPAQPGIPEQEPVNQNRDNFIVDLKTGSIVMVVEAEAIPKLKELIKKLDVPIKMVQIETLLFEKRVSHETNYGLNLLRIGSAATNTNMTSLLFNNAPPPAGILDFLLSRKKTDSGIPAFDLAYRFLLSQDDVQINSCPSILALNQTPAVIAIQDEISISTGIFEIDTPITQLKDSFTRAQYGVNISITPTIHMQDEESENDDDIDYITLDTDITFDTIHAGDNPNRPDVTRRHITNQVQIPDGQTVIIGGLRSKELEDSREAIPFIGELPGIGKLFSITNLADSSTEMYIFITPKIVSDPVEDLLKLRCEQLIRRPGDLPIFLVRLQEARLAEKFALMHNSMRILFSHKLDCYYDSDESEEVISCEYEGEYDGS